MLRCTGASSPPPGNRSTKPEDMRGGPYYKPAYTTQGMPFTGMQVGKDGRFGFENGVAVLDSRMYSGGEFPGLYTCLCVVSVCRVVLCVHVCMCVCTSDHCNVVC